MMLSERKQVRSRLIKAAALTLTGALCFSLMNAVAKYLGTVDLQWSSNSDAKTLTVPALQITFARYSIAALLVLPLMLVRPSRFHFTSPLKYLVRTTAGFGGIALMFFALQTVSIASATAIGFTSPIFAMLFSVVLLREHVTGLRWLAAAFGLIGAVIIASPGSGVPITGAILAITAAAFMGAEIVCVKWLALSKDEALTILFYSNVFGLVISGIFTAAIFIVPTFNQALLLVLVGLMAILGQACFVNAAKKAEASFLAPFFYVSLIYAALIGLFVFGEVPSIHTVLGCLTILVSATIMLRTQ